jgi:selenocysteine lyase/cysteine desulfurase
LTQTEFRALFPALREWAWFDTPGSAPLADPVAEDLLTQIELWRRGSFEWRVWDAAVEESRGLFAQLAGVEVDRVAALASVAEAASTVAASLQPGSIVISDEEYRSVLYPFLALDPRRNPVIRVTATEGVVSTADLVAAIRSDTVLVAASDTLTSNGARIAWKELSDAAHAVEAEVFADLTQAFGVLQYDIDASGIDYAAVHGYKWLLCPRGAAWLVTPPGRVIAPLLPNWKSTVPPFGYFGGELELPPDASRLDTSPAWLSWLGSLPALKTMLRLNPAEVEQHCVGLARVWAEEAARVGLLPVIARQDSHIVVMEAGAAAPKLGRRLAAANVKATCLGTRLRVGVHYFNDLSDIERGVAALGRVS